jgi:hypothetical protein
MCFFCAVFSHADFSGSCILRECRHQWFFFFAVVALAARLEAENLEFVRMVHWAHVLRKLFWHFVWRFSH